MRFNFYVPRMPQDDEESLSLSKADLDGRFFSEGWRIWIVQTCLLLEKEGLEVRLSRQVDKDAINIAHVDDLQPSFIPESIFYVSVQADRSAFLPGAPLTVVQNRKQEDPDLNRFWIPHWPQPGLVPRSSDRKAVLTVGYAGHFKNLGLYPHLFSESCRRCNLQPRLFGPDTWHNMSEVDILAGFRSLDRQTHDRKPASKLVNAWLAEIPFIGGYDSAYEEAGEPDRDYLRVGSPDELERALARLKDEPSLYADIVANGKKRVLAYTKEAIIKQWLDFLNRKATPAFVEWAGRSVST